jgi:DoxX-like family
MTTTTPSDMHARINNPAQNIPQTRTKITGGVKRNHRFWIRTVGYWALTGIIAFEMVAGAMWDLLGIEYVRTVLTHLGYPHYLSLIMAAWKLPCAVVLMVPRFPRLKEWAYAGAVFNYTGAAASHALAGDPLDFSFGVLMYAVITLGSWALRPADRRLPKAGPTSDTRLIDWIVPVFVVAVLLVISLLTLPVGPARDGYRIPW